MNDELAELIQEKDGVSAYELLKIVEKLRERRQTSLQDELLRVAIAKSRVRGFSATLIGSCMLAIEMEKNNESKSE